MNNQGLFGAISQYWTIDEKPRLHRKNTFFEDHPKFDNKKSFSVGIVFSMLALAIIVLWSVMGVIL